MGLLDDAIREHLELKRRAGADAMDVARQEREALGAGGRSDPLAAPPPEEDDPYGEAPFATPAPAGHYEGPYDDEPDDEYYYEEEDYAPQPAVAPPPPVQAAPPPPAPAAPPQPPPPGPATEEYRLPPVGHEPEDVLEQTPDFLQETPEHDRLWFEQAPPQEFDFDK